MKAVLFDRAVLLRGSGIVRGEFLRKEGFGVSMTTVRLGIVRTPRQGGRHHQRLSPAQGPQGGTRQEGKWLLLTREPSSLAASAGFARNTQMRDCGRREGAQN